MSTDAKGKKKKQLSAHDIQNLLSSLFPSGANVLLSELRNGTGFERKRIRTADAVAVSVWPSRGLHLSGIEIKVARSDWLKELANPDKADAIQKYCKYWYLAVPKGLVTEGEVPETWGLIECSRTARIVKAAPVLECKEPDILLVCSILRSVGKQYTSTATVWSQIESEVTKRMDNKAEDYELRCLKEKVELFEKASGVSLDDRWNAAEIGSAVEFVREVGVDKAVQRTKRLQKEHQRLADHLEELLNKVEPEEATEEAG